MRAMAVVVGLLLPLGMQVPANAQAHAHYGERAEKVAKELRCQEFKSYGSGPFHLDSGVCYLKGSRVNVITFRSRVQDEQWNARVTAGFGPKFYWADGRGAVVVSKYGSRLAAALGARRLPGTIKHG